MADSMFQAQRGGMMRGRGVARGRGAAGRGGPPAGGIGGQGFFLVSTPALKLQPHNVTKLNNRPQPVMLPPPDNCICHRTVKCVLCQDCGKSVEKVRVRTPCPAHPKEIAFMDMKACSKCRGDKLVEI